MLKTKRTLLIACAVILLCVCVVVGMTYALFTDSATVKNHLQAGTLNIDLVRTNLSYGILDSEGYLCEDSVNEEFNFTGSTNENIFGLDASSLKIAPGCYFAATLEIRNKGDVAFTYNVGIKVTQSSQLARQLKVSIQDENGNPLLDKDGNEIQPKMLSAFGTGFTIAAGEMSAADLAERFIVRVEFMDQRDHNKPDMTEDELIWNNSAKNDAAAFDLIITAIQATH